MSDRPDTGQQRRTRLRIADILFDVQSFWRARLGHARRFTRGSALIALSAAIMVVLLSVLFVTSQRAPTPSPARGPTGSGTIRDGALPASRVPNNRAWTRVSGTLRWSPDGSVLAIARREGVEIVDASTLTEIARLPRGDASMEPRLCELALTHRADAIAIGLSTELRVWSKGLETERFRHTASQPGVVAFSPDAKRVHLVTQEPGNPEVQVLDAASGRLLHRRSLSATSSKPSAFSPDATMLVGTRPLRGWNARDGRILWSNPAGVHAIQARFSPDSATVLVSDGREAHVLDAASGSTVRTLGLGAAFGAALGKRWVVVSQGEILRVLRSDTGAEVWSLEENGNLRSGPALRPSDDRRACCNSLDRAGAAVSSGVAARRFAAARDARTALDRRQTAPPLLPG